MLFDTHCHINFNSYKDDGHEVIRRSLDAHAWMNIVGSQIDTSRRAIEYASQYGEGVYASVGLHPVHLVETVVHEEDVQFRTRAEVFDREVYLGLAQHSKVVAIGEMGIDYYRIPEGTQVDEHKALQRETFVKGIELAKELGKPIIIHTRPSVGTHDAYDDVYDILVATDCHHGVVHCFGGTLEHALKFIDQGLLVSFTGNITFKKNDLLRDIVKELPLEKVMIETDAPFMTPEPYRGKRNIPEYVRYVSQTIADVKGVSCEEVAEVTTNTARVFFRI